METNQNGKFSVDLDLPYPPVQPETHRKEYAYAMLSNVGSDNSEMSAVSLYFYNSILLSPQHAAFARCFHQISIVEMHHLDIFASFAHQMGLDPRLWSVQGGRSHYWTPAYNRYPQQLPALLQKTIQDANIVANLQRIIQDEEHHVRLFRSMLAEVAET